MIKTILDEFQAKNTQQLELYKTIRSNIEFSSEDKKVIAFTSAVSDANKTVIAFNVACSFADAGKRVIYINANNKNMEENADNTQGEIIGLSDYLKGDNKMSEIVREGGIPNLLIISTGTGEYNPVEYMTDKKFHVMIEAFRDVMDYIIVDAPALGDSADGAFVIKECEGLIYIITSRTVSYKTAQQVKKQIERTGCPILGAVLNKDH